MYAKLIERLHYFLCYCPEAYTYIPCVDDLVRLRRQNNVLSHVKQLAYHAEPSPRLITYIAAYLVYAKYIMEVDFRDLRALLLKGGLRVRCSLADQELALLKAIGYDFSFLV